MKKKGYHFTLGYDKPAKSEGEGCNPAILLLKITVSKKHLLSMGLNLTAPSSFLTFLLPVKSDHRISFDENPILAYILRTENGEFGQNRQS